MMNTAHFGRIMRERRENSIISLRAEKLEIEHLRGVVEDFLCVRK